ncbi:hypothetical protein M9Y10_017259, partial [Tritrichomonas musculus]
IVPIFNKLNYLNRSFTSLQLQTLKKIQIIAIDDYSSDNSSLFVLSLMKNDHRIKLIQHTSNRGTCLSRIHGVLSSNGVYILSLDPDDMMYSNAAEQTYQSAMKSNADILEFRIEGRYSKGIAKNWIPCHFNYSTNKVLLDKFLKFNFGLVNWNTCKKIIRGKLYKHSMYFLLPYVKRKKINNAEDLLHCGIIFLFMKKFVCTQILAYIYFLSNKDSSSRLTYQSKTQNLNQLTYVKYLIQYFYANRMNPFKCNLKNFLTNKTHLKIYDNITNIPIQIKLKCFYKIP